MQRFAPIPEGGGQGGREASSRNAQEIRQAGGRGYLLRRQAVENYREQYDEEQPHGKTLHELWRHEGEKAGIGRKPGAHEVGYRIQTERYGRQCARIETAHEAADEERSQYGGHAARRRHQPRPGRRIAQETLQPQGYQHNVAEEYGVAQAQRDRAERKAARLEQAQVNDRMFFGEFPDQPRGEGNQGDDQ